MPPPRPTLLVPVENQVRELDAKLLFSLVAAERGYPVILGSRATLHREAASLPRGVYVAKSVRVLSTRMFKIYRDLGSEIVSWDEESLVRGRDSTFWYRRRIGKEAFDQVRAVFAWGEDDAEIFRGYPQGCKPSVHATGNPRLDLTRPELRGYFDDDVIRLRNRYGDFILVNSNFGLVNHYVDSLSGVAPLPPGESTEEERTFAEGLLTYRSELFEAFKLMVPSVAKAFPNLRIVVRPHPVEKHDPWQEIASQHDNVELVQEGNVLPWLLAASVLIHNGCTTGVEAYTLGVPSVSYEPVSNERFDWELPNELSRRVADLDELNAQLRDVLADGASGIDSRQCAIAKKHMTSIDGALACDRIVEVLDTLYAGKESQPLERPGAARYAAAWIHCHGRAAWKNMRAGIPGNRNSADYQKYRFPGVDVSSLRDSTDRFAKQLGRFGNIEIRERSADVFEISRR
jgi:surface carbohydrate biosynthesis protein